MDVDLDNVYGKPKFVGKVPIYPVRMDDIIELYDSSSCLLVPKNSMNDARVIKMSYLAFLINISNSPDTEHLLSKLLTLIEIITRSNDVKFQINEKEKFIIVIDDEYEIHERDFDKVRDIIGIQNLMETRNDSLGSDFDKAKDKAKADITRRSGKMADLEQQIIAYKCVQKSTYDEIRNLTIYQFRKEIERIDLIKSAHILQSAQYSGMVSFKEGTVIPHWLDYIKDKNPEDDLVLTKEQLDQLSAKNGLVGS